MAETILYQSSFTPHPPIQRFDISPPEILRGVLARNYNHSTARQNLDALLVQTLHMHEQYLHNSPIAFGFNRFNGGIRYDQVGDFFIRIKQANEQGVYFAHGTQNLIANGIFLTGSRRERDDRSVFNQFEWVSPTYWSSTNSRAHYRYL